MMELLNTLFSDLKLMWENAAAAFPAMVLATRYTLAYAVGSMVLGVIIAFVVAMLRVSRTPILDPLARLYVSVIRGTPLLVQIYMTYYGVPSFWQTIDASFPKLVPDILIDFPVWLAGTLALALNVGAYMSETIRGSIEGISKGQWEAARSLGLNHLQTLSLVVLPQALRTALPSMGNSFVGLLKDTSLLSVITIPELMKVAYENYSRTFDGRAYFLSAALIYWVLSSIFSALQRRLEAHLARAHTV
ncbi:amino acid ABC transporter permease [Deinococcus cellulosilyticus]|uniref:Cysteine ABC transporter n=1 Tax=Deinococcus cellulosilyticus (strain DSM 18568 / NBRC 106333 / KACC 11606 / 5516J-15) TaxID=1223518 RepID=A0A511MX44_DEIC1|nr:amino acid ABC transporter permease [Deinococcus cellulosilyticus]GEM45153.1 cysteine ABC transporter [Deinococcus cellulosilyticus NBRC 106333 = KACC 11606]